MNTEEILSRLQDGGRLVTIERIPIAMNLDELMRVTISLGRQFTPLFEVDGENIRAYTNALKWLIADPTMQADHPNGNHVLPGDLSKGLLICGGTGTGKSLLIEILNALATVLTPRIKTYYKPTFQQGGRSAGYQEVPLLWRSYRADELTDSYQSKGELDKFKSITSLAIQDVGTEPQEVLYMGTRCNVVRQVLESRADNKGLMTLATTNLTLDELGERYEARVKSRLFSMFNFLFLGGRDRRLF